MRRDPGADEDELAGALEALAVLLDAGVTPETAWAYLGEELEHPAVRRVASSVGAGARPVEALQAVAGLADNPAFGAIAAAWAVAEVAGAALAPALRSTAVALRDRAETAREVDAALSGPRATARLMGWLPMVGILMAGVIGVDVIGTLFQSPPGWILLTLGTVLIAAGRIWTRRLVARTATRGAVPGADLDLMAIALAGGMSVPTARSVIGEVRGRLRIPAVDNRALDRVLRVAERAGAPAVELLLASSQQERRAARMAGRRSAATLAVRLLLPLGVCVLPAFLVLGVAPVILAMISSTLAGLV